MSEDKGPHRNTLMMAGHLDDVMRHLRRLAGQPPGGGAADAHLLARYSGAREEEAFRALLQRHGPMVLGVCRRLLRDPHAAEDAFQATFLVLLRRAASIARPELLGNWLYGVAYRVATRARQQAGRRGLREAPLPAEVPAPPDEDPAWRDLRPLLDAEIARLQEPYRQPVVLCYVEGRTCEEAGLLLGCPAGTVKSRLSRARELLRRRLARHGLGLGATLAAALAPERLCAALPAELAARTGRAALELAAGRTLGDGGFSAGAAALAKGVLHAMKTTRLKLAAALALLVGVLGVGAGLALHRAWAGKEAERGAPTPAAPAQPRPEPAARAQEPEDPLPLGAVARLGSARLRHEGAVRALAFAPGGKQLASASADKSLRVWDATTGKEVRRFTDHQADVLCAAYSPDGTRLASGGTDCTVRVRDAATGRRLLALDGHEVAVNQVAFSPDGKVLASASGPAVRLWSAQTGKLLHRLTDPKFAKKSPGPLPVVSLLAFARDGKTLLTVGPLDTVSVWAVTPGKCLRQFHIRGGTAYAVALASDGRTLAVVTVSNPVGAARFLVRLWDVAAEKELRALAFTEPPYAVAFTPDGKHLAAAGHGQEVCIWEVESGKRVRTFKGLPEPHRALAVAPDGKTIATGGEQRVRLWEVTSGQDRLRLADWPGIRALALSGDGKLAALGCRDHTVRLVDRASGRELRRCGGAGNGEPGAVAFLPDGKTVVAVSEASWALRFFDVATGKEVRRAGGERDGFTGNPPLAASPAGRHLAFRNQSTALILYDIKAGKARRLTAHGLGRWPLAFSPDGKALASSERGGDVLLWDVASGKPGKSFRAPGLRPVALAFSPDGKRLAAASYRALGGTLHVWDVPTGKLVRQIGKPALDVPAPDEPHARGWHGLALLSGGLLVAADEEAAHLWDVNTGAKVSVFRGHDAPVTCLACSPDGKTIATASEDRTVLFWDPQARVGVAKAPQPPEKPTKLPLEARLVAKKATFPPAPKKLIEKDMDEPLRFHPVDLVLELRNVTDKEVKVRLFPRPLANDLEGQAGARDSWLGLKLKVKGPIAQVGQMSAGGLEGRVIEKKEVTIPPGKSHTLRIRSLTYPSKDGNVLNYFLCPPGEYTVEAVFDTVLSPAPPGSRNVGLGFGRVTLTSNAVKLKCK
jgi:RNA polymerase sigma factor (sigma-70 family)